MGRTKGFIKEVVDGFLSRGGGLVLVFRGLVFSLLKQNFLKRELLIC